MPILVTCSKCQAQFKVSDKFAGKKGPCPKCKAPITIPDPSKATTPAGEEIKIHGGEDFAGTGAKTAEGRPVLKPIARQELKLTPVKIAAMVVGVIAMLAGAYFAGPFLQEMLWLRAIALFVVSLPITIATYAVLRNDELEPYSGRNLWIRATICSAIYAAMWAGYLFVPPDMLEEIYGWAFIIPPFMLLGAGVSYGCFDLDFGSACFHYGFYAVVTMLLGWLAGLEMPWEHYASVPEFGQLFSRWLAAVV